MCSASARAIVEQRREVAMTTIPQEPSPLARGPSWIDARDMWTSLAIVAMWIVVLVAAVLGPNIESVDAGGNSATVPSAIVLALFALFGTIAVAKYGFGTKAEDN
jgi:hypothetical protein